MMPRSPQFSLVPSQQLGERCTMNHLMDIWKDLQLFLYVLTLDISFMRPITEAHGNFNPPIHIHTHTLMQNNTSELAPKHKKREGCEGV